MSKAEGAKTESRKYLIKGRVQGVGFRWFVEREAKIIGVSGWVRNLDNGSVEAVACGTDAQLSAFYSRLRIGPPAARIDDVDVLPAPEFTGSNSFSIEGTC